MKANFVRKPTPEQIYPRDEFAIEKVVRITPDEVADLIANPLADRSYVKENKRLMYQDESGTMHCIYIVAEGYDYGILIESEGADYPRYTAFLPTGVFDL